MADFNINDFSDLGEIISSNKDKLKEVTATSNVGGFAPLPDGWYLTELEEINLKRTSTQKPMISGKFRIKENGTGLKDNKLSEIPNTANRIIFKNWVISSRLEDPEGKSYQRFKSDALKLVAPVLGADDLAEFSDLLDDLTTLPAVFDALIGYQVYIQCKSKPDKTDPSKINTESDLKDWDNAAETLGL